MIYLASPYSHPDPAVREARFQAACRATSKLIDNGIATISPIVHAHSLVTHGLPSNRTGWDDWANYDTELLTLCSELWVLMLDGWSESMGVRAEIEIAREQSKRIVHLTESDWT